MRLLTALLCAVWLLAGSADAWAGFYRWVDREGNEFFTNDPSKVPPEYRNQTTSVEPREERVTVGTDRPPARERVAVAEHKDQYGRGEQWWRKRAGDLRRKLRDLQAEYDLVVKQERDWQAKQKSVKSRKKTAPASPYAKKISRLELQISKYRRMLEVELPDEARRAGAYPGWIRE